METIKIKVGNDFNAKQMDTVLSEKMGKRYSIIAKGHEKDGKRMSGVIKVICKAVSFRGTPLQETHYAIP